jgi:hypothetical protein
MVTDPYKGIRYFKSEFIFKYKNIFYLKGSLYSLSFYLLVQHSIVFALVWGAALHVPQTIYNVLATTQYIFFINSLCYK